MHRNDTIFNSIHWHVEKTHQHVWDALFDYGRVEWQKTLKVLEITHDVAYDDVLEHFDLV